MRPIGQIEAGVLDTLAGAFAIPYVKTSLLPDYILYFHQKYKQCGIKEDNTKKERIWRTVSKNSKLRKRDYIGISITTVFIAHKLSDRVIVLG